MNKVLVFFPIGYQREYGFPKHANMILVARDNERARVKAHDTAETIDIPAGWIEK